MRYKNGDIYNGGWQAGQRCGHGKCSFKTGEEYVGEWRCDERMGKGKCVLVDGSVYDGELKANPHTCAYMCLGVLDTQVSGRQTSARVSAEV